MATFLDREPYIRFWRPTYRVLGPVIRRCKSFVSGAEQKHLDYENRLAAVEAAQKQNSALLEQVLIATLSERQIPRAIEEMRGIFISELSKHTAEISAANAAQWAAIEQLIVAVMGNSSPSQIIRKKEHVSNGASTPGVGKVP